MDGNNRWSKKNNKSKEYSYNKGAKKLIKLSNYIFTKTKVNYISAFALSKNNMNRSKTIINVIKNILTEFANTELTEKKLNYGLVFIGDLGFLDQKTRYQLFDLQSYGERFVKKLIIYINYSGSDDIIHSAKEIIKQKKPITISNFKNNLLTSNFLDPDLLIRTGGFQRISDFMLFQLSFTELFFFKKLWPDLSIENINKTITQYNLIERKFGI